MNVPTLIVIPKLYLGGAETQLRMLFTNLYPNGVYLLALDKSFSSEKENFIARFKSNIIECRLFFSSRTLRRINSWFLLFWLLPYYKIRYRIKNLFVIESDQLLLLPLMKLLGLKVIYSERNNGHHKHAKIYDLIAQCDYICSNSIEAKVFLESMIGKKVEVINNGVSIPHQDIVIRPRSLPFKILIPARIDPKKNQELVIIAAKFLSDCEFHFAGKITDKKYQECLIEKSKRLQNVIFDGYISNIRNYYKGFDLVLLPSIEEGTSNVILECLADGIPCVVSDIDMNIRLQRNRNYVFKVDNYADLIRVITQFRRINVETITKDLRDARKWVTEFYSENKMVESYIKLFSGY